MAHISVTGDSDSGSVKDASNAEIAIDLDANETIIVTFKNAQGTVPSSSGVLTITKSVTGSTNSGPYAITVTGSTGYLTTTTVMSGTPTVLTSLAGGLYTVTETSPGAGWVTTYTVASAPATVLSGQAVVNLSNASSIAAFAAVPVSGKVYNDYNSNGVLDTTGVAPNRAIDTGVANVKVTAYGVSGATCNSATSDATGNYSFTPTCAGPWRLFFSDLPSGYEPTTHGPSAGSGANSTSVQFVTASGASNVNFAVLQPCDYCQNAPAIAGSFLRSGSITQTPPVGVSTLSDLYQVQIGRYI